MPLIGFPRRPYKEEIRPTWYLTQSQIMEINKSNANTEVQELLNKEFMLKQQQLDTIKQLEKDKKQKALEKEQK